MLPLWKPRADGLTSSTREFVQAGLDCAALHDHLSSGGKLIKGVPHVCQRPQEQHAFLGGEELAGKNIPVEAPSLRLVFEDGKFQVVRLRYGLEVSRHDAVIENAYNESRVGCFAISNDALAELIRIKIA